MQTLRLKLSALCCAALFPLAAHAGGGGMLRISCDGDANGAAVTINGKFKGDCPMDMAIGAGSWNLRVVKKVDSDHERVYAETVRIGDDVVKKIEVSLGDSILTPAGQKKADQRCKPEVKKAFADIATDMVRIPEGNFEMGKYEVTQEQWYAVMGNNPSEFSACGEYAPVTQVSWNDVQIFIQKLNAKTGKSYRLPTESEWETACLAGSNTNHCGGNDADAVAWHPNNSQGDHPVGQKKPNVYGFYDMSGNVWEWTQDCSGEECRTRGGSSGHFNMVASATRRFNLAPATRFYSVGFRLARTLP